MQKRTHSKQNLNPDYVVGLVDGEGSFTIYVRNPDAEKVVVRRVVVEPKFYIKLIERDKNILYALQDFFGVEVSTSKKTPDRIINIVIATRSSGGKNSKR